MTGTGPEPDMIRTCNDLALVSTWLAVICLATYGDVVQIWRQPGNAGLAACRYKPTGRKGERGMTKDSDPVTVTLQRGTWKAVLLALSVTNVAPANLRHLAELAIESALNPPAAPDPATFEVKVPDPKRTKPWPELKSSQDASGAV